MSSNHTDLLLTLLGRPPACSRGALLALLAACVGCSGGLNDPTAGDAPPNFVWILADDLGYGDLGSYGQERIQTPHLDRMAAEGMRFTDAYAGFTVCAPSRSVLMTGQHTGHTRVRRNGSPGLWDEDVTVAELLKDKGYATALIGKWGLGMEDSPGAPWRQGFDHFYGYLSQGHAHNYYPEFLMRNAERVPLRNVVQRSGRYTGMSGVATERIDYSHDLMMGEALSWLEANAASPFFLYLALTIPHANNEAGNRDGGGDPGIANVTADLGQHRERVGMEVPDARQYQEEDWPGPQKGTAAMISHLDEGVGRVFAALRRLGVDERTMVFFSSDNGPHAEGGNDPFFFDSNGPLQGYKRSLHDGGIRVPTIVRWPGRVRAGSVSDFPWYFADFLPTVADIAGFDVPDGVDGASILPVLLETGASSEDRFLYWGGTSGRAEAVRWGRWKAVREAPDRPLELFDLSSDIGEERDVSAEHEDIVGEILAYLESAVTELPASE
ncbi:MAG: arylsulfatase [Acidobacteriia bacterium]|nr:arylsulfatase [Terriglobia bacterium]